MSDDFRARRDSVNVIAVFRVDGVGTLRLARKGELSDYRPTETYLERWDDDSETWSEIGTVAFLEAHPKIADVMDL